MESYESSEGADKIIIDLLSQLLKLGSKLAIIPKVRVLSSGYLRTIFLKDIAILLSSCVARIVFDIK